MRKKTFTFNIAETFSKFQNAEYFDFILARLMIQDFSNTLKLFIYCKCDILSSLAEVVLRHNDCKSWVCIVLVLFSCNDIISDSAEACNF